MIGKVVFAGLVLVTMIYAGNYLPMKDGFATFDHDTGNCLLSVCANGAIGFWDSNQSQGSGFWYPLWVNTTLFCGSNAVGNATDYIVDSYFGPDWEDDRDWEPMEDSLWYHIPPEFGLQEIDGRYDDHGSTNSNPKDLQCFQFSVANAEPTYDDFVIVEFIYKNAGSSAINGLYSGVFVDFDIPNNMNNYVKTDSALRTVYAQKSFSDDNPTVGIVYLGSEPQPELNVSNLAAVPHYDYVNTGFLDSFKYLWMNGTYQKAESDSEGDWSVMIATGGFDLGVGAEQHVAYAFVGGTSESEYKTHCQNAINFYNQNWPGVEEETQDIREGLWFGSTIVKNQLVLNYALAHKNKVNVRLFDVSGRNIATLYSGKLSGKGKMKIKLNNIANGVYFANIEGGEKTSSCKILVVR